MCLGATRWRMLRKILVAKKAGALYKEFRGWARRDATFVNQLIHMGLVRRLPNGRFVLTEAGVAAAEFGEVDAGVFERAVKETPNVPPVMYLSK